MGFCQSTRRGEPGSTPTAASIKKKSLYSWDAKTETKNPNDYILKDLHHRLAVNRNVAGEQFNMENLDNCDIYLLDYTSAIFMDGCTNCRVFCGAVSGSFFIRDCSSCKVVVACQQFRVRDCRDIIFLLFSQTEPVIETSTEIQIGCFDFSYFQLGEHFTKAGLNPYCNKWWQVHDFNSSEGVSNWSVSLATSESILATKRSGISEDELGLPSVVPYTSGGKDSGAMVFFLPGTSTSLNLFLQHARETKWTFTRMRSYELKGSEARALVGREITEGETVGVEIATAPDIFEDVERVVANLTNSSVYMVPKEQLVSTARTFFESLKDQV